MSMKDVFPGLPEGERSNELRRWGDDQQYLSEPVPGNEPRVHLLHATEDPLGVVAAMAGMYEGTIIRELDLLEEWNRLRAFRNVQKTHLQAPFEAIQFLFLIEGVDRAFTHQLVRSRMFTYAQESMRFAVVEDLADRVTVPPSVAQHEDRGVEAIWRHAIQDLAQAYTVLVNNGVPAEDARGLLPTATQTRIVVRCDYRNLLKTAGDRLCTQAQFVWRNVFAQMVDRIRNYPYYNPMTVRELDEPSNTWIEYPVGELLTDAAFVPVCYQLGHCPFGAEFDRRCTIRERVQRGAFEEIGVGEWLLDPTAARRPA